MNLDRLKLQLNHSAVKIPDLLASLKTTKWIILKGRSLESHQNQCLQGCFQERDFSCCFPSRAEPSHWLQSFCDSCTSRLPRGVTRRSRGVTTEDMMQNSPQGQTKPAETNYFCSFPRYARGSMYFIPIKGKTRNQPIIGPIPMRGVTTWMFSCCTFWKVS